MAPLTTICLTPVKNEAWILDRFLACASLWADHIIIADQMSDDGSREIARAHPKVTLVDNRSAAFNEPQRQQLLLDAARRIEGPRLLVALDADEMLTANVLTSPEWNRVLDAPPGTVIRFRWVNLRPGARSYWSPAYRFPWGIVDDGSGHVGREIHSPRIPAPPGAPEIALDEIKVLHYQYTNWARMRSKHRWYQCWERLNNSARHPIDIYRQYHHMYAIPRRDIHPVPAEWMAGYEALGIDMSRVTREDGYWWDRELASWLVEHGPATFKREAIWEVDSPAWKVRIGNLPLTDPRGAADRLFQKWLAMTQPVSGTRLVRALDRVAKVIYR